MAQTITTDKFGDLTFDSKSFLYNYSSGKDKVAGQFKIGGKQYTFIPQNIIEKGFISDGKQKYLGNILVGDNLKALGTEGVYIDLAGVSNLDKSFEKKGWSTTGFLVPAKVASERKLVSSVRSYDVAGKDIGAGMSAGAIQGISEVGGKPVYVTEPKGKAQSTWIQPPDTAGYDGQGGTGTHQGRYTYTKNKFGFIGDIASSIGKIVGGVPLLPELIGFATGQPLVAAALRGAAGGAAGMDPLKAGLLGGVSAAGVQAGLNVKAGLDPISGLPSGAVGGTPGVSTVTPVAPPGGTAAPLAPTTSAAGAAGSGMLGSGISTTPAATAAGMGGGTGITAGAGGTAAGMGGGSGLITGSGAVDLLTGATLPAAVAGGALSAEALGDLFPTALGVAEGGSILEDIVGGAKDVKSLFDTLTGGDTGNFLTDLLGAGINYGIDEATIKRLTDLAQKEKEKVQAGFRDLAAQSEVPFTPYTVSTGFGTSTFGPEQATTALSPEYAGIRDTALAKSAEALGSINPATATQDYYNTLEALAAPTRQREQDRLLGTLGSRGLLGFGQNMPTAGGMTRTVNPLMESLLSSQASERLQQTLAAQQYGTTDAANRAALSSSLLGMGTGLDTTAANQLFKTAELGQIPYQADVANKERQLQLLENALRAGMPYDEAVFNLAMGKETNLGDFYRKTAENIFNEIFK